MTPVEFTALYQGTLDRMVAARWIERFAFTPQAGITIRWTDEGRKRASALWAIVHTYDLRGGPHNARQFDMQAAKLNRKKITPESDDNHIAAFYWRLCMKELQLDRDDFDFGGLVHIIDDYAPELKGPKKPPGDKGGKKGSR
jgi:hypothetical protein